MGYVERAITVDTDMHKELVELRQLPVNQVVPKAQHHLIVGSSSKAFANLVTSVNFFTVLAICQIVSILKYHLTAL